MITRTALLLLATLAVSVQALDMTYSELVASRNVVDMGISLSYKDKNTPDATKYNDGKPVPIDNEDLLSPRFTHDDDSVLVLTVNIPENVADSVLKKTTGGVVLDPPKYLTVKLCYGTEWTKNRKWRGIKDKISKDKRCKNKVINKLDLTTVNGTSYMKEYTLPSDVASARWFFTAYLICGVKGKEGETVECGLDTTGKLATLFKGNAAQAVGKATESGDKAAGQELLDELSPTTSAELHISTKVRESRPTGLWVAVFIMSGLSLSLLFGFFAYEQLTKKNK